jgi:hypothetical protein
LFIPEWQFCHTTWVVAVEQKALVLKLKAIARKLVSEALLFRGSKDKNIRFRSAAAVKLMNKGIYIYSE